MIEYIGIGAGLLAFELAYLMIARKLGIVDLPHHQSSHTGAIIRGGGVVFYVAYLLWFVMSDYQYPMIFAGLSIIAMTSFADDIHSISPKVRMVLQFIALMVMLYETRVFNFPIVGMIFLSVVCVGIVNIYNFMDGINGMTGGYSLVVTLALIYVNNYVVLFIDNQLLLYLLLSIVVFNLFNFRKRAKCFAGDVGSLSIGFVLVFLILKFIVIYGHMFWVAFLIVYSVDGGMTILHRILLRENLMKPHKKHAYQIMANELKIPHLLVSGVYMILQAICCAVFIAWPSYYTLSAEIVVLTVIYLVFMKKYYHLHEKKWGWERN